ncbi:MAG: hypothetical protein ABIO99_03015 [Candidatus Limnocylindria bacterium]
MSTDRDTTRIVRSWLEDGVTSLPDRVLDAVLDELPATPQRRVTWWPARRLSTMNNAVKFGLAAAVVAVAALLGFNYFVGPNVGGPGLDDSTPTPTVSPIALPAGGALAAGTYVATPFAGPTGFGVCEGQSGCVESPADDSITFTVTVPDGWFISGLRGIWVNNNAPPDGAILIFWRGGWLYSDPCTTDGKGPDIEVGPTVDDFAAALADHPLLDVSTPIDVTLGGYSGRYVDVQAPSNIDQCTTEYRLWDPNVYAQGANQQWHLWILDVDGVRVVVETMDYAGSSAQHQADLQAMLDSLQIAP